MTTLFVSDVHLSAARPDRVDAFFALLDAAARGAQAMYILGDLFDLWLGDDDDRDPHRCVVDALSKLTGAGVALHVVHGNHDFLLGREFVAATGCSLIEEFAVAEIEGTRVLVMHGDTLCTRDTEYQAFRRYSRDPANQAEFLSLNLAARLERATAIRRSSNDATRLKPDDIMDVTDEAVRQAYTSHDVAHLVHGHTHRPAIHRLRIEEHDATRIVLGDWYEHDSVLLWTREGFALGDMHSALEALETG